MTSTENSKNGTSGFERFNEQGQVTQTTACKIKVDNKLIEDIFYVYGVDTSKKKLFERVKHAAIDSISKCDVFIIAKYNQDVAEGLPKEFVDAIGKSELVVTKKDGKFIFKFSTNYGKAPEPMEKDMIRIVIREQIKNGNMENI